MNQVSVPPVIVTCAVRYALGRGSYVPGLVADQVRACWDDLGDQRDVIFEDVRRWLTDDLPKWQAADWDAWQSLYDWMVEQ